MMYPNEGHDGSFSESAIVELFPFSQERFLDFHKENNVEPYPNKAH